MNTINTLSEDIYFNNILTKRICVKAKYLNEDINDYILNYLKKNIEGKCINEGYVKYGSIKIVKKSIGQILGSRFTGDITYDILYTGDVCNPVTGNIIDCKVKFINKLGILGNNGPISITIPKQLHKNEEFEHINIGDVIKVEVIVKKFSLNQKEIKLVAKLYNENENKTSKSQSIKKKDELLSSDLIPIDNDYDKLEQINTMDENEEDENEEDDNEEEISMVDSDIINSDDDLDSELDDEEVKIKMENPDENVLDMGDIEIDDDEDNADIEEDDEDEDDDESSIDYD